MPPIDEKKPAYLKGFLWFAFSGTAMLSAFILPVHIWALANNFWMPMESRAFINNFFFRLYFFVLLSAALYHGLYRTETILFDLGILKHGRINTTIFLLACVFSIAAAYLFFLA